MDDACPVRRRQTLCYRRPCFRGLTPTQRAGLEALAQGLALEQLGHRVGDIALGIEIEDLEDAGM